MGKVTDIRIDDLQAPELMSQLLEEQEPESGGSMSGILDNPDFHQTGHLFDGKISSHADHDNGHFKNCEIRQWIEAASSVSSRSGFMYRLEKEIWLVEIPTSKYRTSYLKIALGLRINPQGNFE